MTNIFIDPAYPKPLAEICYVYFVIDFLRIFRRIDAYGYHVFSQNCAACFGLCQLLIRMQIIRFPFFI